MEKKLAFKVKELQEKYPEKKVELWTEDEHRIGLKPIYRRIWVPWWDVPTASLGGRQVGLKVKYNQVLKQKLSGQIRERYQ